MANIAAHSVLKELRNPEPPVPLDGYLSSKKWIVQYEELHGPDGYMVKLHRNKKTRFIIYLASDQDTETPYDVDTIMRRQYFTLAHELGHILLHGNYILNSHADMQLIPEKVAGIMEVEAHWFASRLLMPNYVFKNVVDLIPDHLADKCGVNITPAHKRLRNLERNIRTSILQGARMDKWPPLENLKLPIFTNEAKYESWAAYEESVASVEQINEKIDHQKDTEIWQPKHKRNEENWERNSKMLDQFRRIYGFD